MPKPLLLKLLVAATALFASSAALAFTAQKWQEDYAQLKDELSRVYANLDDIAKHRKLDLAALDRRTRAELESATSDEAAARVLRRFLDEFRDGHLRLLPPLSTSGASAAPTQSAAQGDAPTARCARLGYRAARERGLSWQTVPQFTPLVTADDVVFPAGIVAARGNAPVGLIRINSFSENSYPVLCERILTKHAPCDAECEQRVAAEVRAEISRTLARQANALIERGIGALVIDVTGNGGGSDWAEAAARMFAAPGLKSTPLQFIKHPHWQRRFEGSVRAIDQDLNRTDLAPEVKSALRDVRQRLQQAAAVASTPCDRRSVWEGESRCRLLGSAGLFATGAYAARPPFALNRFESAHVLFSPHTYLNLDGTYRGPLAILIDGNTASAAEQFAGMLKDGGSATLIGRQTLGAGCGYTDGGVTITLQHSKARVRAPDCARVRTDHNQEQINEVLGLKPDAETMSSAAADYLDQIARWSERIAPAK